jgi:hypothetical protein
MELIYRAAFNRSFKNIRNKNVLANLAAVIRQVEKAKSKDDIGGLKKLRLYSHYYRIKIKVSDKYDYRLVLMIRNSKVWFEDIALAKKIFYKR